MQTYTSLDKECLYLERCGAFAAYYSFAQSSRFEHVAHCADYWRHVQKLAE